MPKPVPVVISSEPRTDGSLSVVEVSDRTCVLSDGEVLFLRYDKLQALCEQVCQEQAAVWVRTWWTISDGVELIELRRVGETSTELPMAALPNVPTVF